jgi:hypothetical protein
VLEQRLGRLLSVAGLIAVVAAVLAVASIWLLLTDPVTIVTAVEGGEITPFIRELAQVIYKAIAGLLKYF